MFKFNLLKLSFYCAFLLITGCSQSFFGNGLGNLTMRVSPIPVSGLGASTPFNFNVGMFQEGRKNPREIGLIQGETMLPNEDPTQAVRYALEEALIKKGGQMSIENGTTIEGELTDWFITAERSFLSMHIESIAGLKITVISPQGEVLLTSEYKGLVEEESIFAGRHKLESILASSMSNAIQEILYDERFKRSIGIE
jgi:uncharacterized lipoprotein YajG